MNPNTILLANLIAATGLASAASAQPLPAPYPIVSHSDFECYRSTDEPPPASQVRIRHLNPALQGLTQTATIHELRRVCLPVEKNNQTPPPEVRRYIQWIDLACYRAEASPVDLTLNVSHLNPELSGLPSETIRVERLAQLCLPVRKAYEGGAPPIPPDVRRFIQHVDLACYALDERTQDVQLPLSLGHLNPVVASLPLEDRQTRLRRGFQLCLPVGKNDQPIPPDVLNVIQWMDFLRYTLDPVPPFNINLALRHMNPLFWALPWFGETLFTPPTLQLMVPIAKNTTTGGRGLPTN